MDYSIQLYSLRDITQISLEEALKSVSAMGYKYVEFAGFFGNSARDIKEMLDKYGLKVSGTHTGREEIEREFEQTVRYHKAIGNTNIIIPGFDYSTKEKLDDFINFANKYSEKLAAEGITLSYHNHSGEFETTDYGQIVHSELEKRTGITFEIDTYWVFHAGLDPVEVLRRLDGRVNVIHIKDGMRNGAGMPLGMGEAPVDAVWKYAREKNIFMCVESETLTPSGPYEAEVCLEYLRALEEKEKNK